LNFQGVWTFFCAKCWHNKFRKKIKRNSCEFPLAVVIELLPCANDTGLLGMKFDHLDFWKITTISLCYSTIASAGNAEVSQRSFAAKGKITNNDFLSL
jgi:hypothetical protein